MCVKFVFRGQKLYVMTFFLFPNTDSTDATDESFIKDSKDERD